MEGDEEPPRGMTRARWAAVACLVALFGVPVLSLLFSVASAGDDGGVRRQLLVGLLAAVLLLGLIVVVVRRIVRDRVGSAPDGPGDWWP